jgi:hypothetical protein
MRETPPSQIQFVFDEFARDGETAVRDNLALNRYSRSRADLARRWIEQLDHSRLSESERERRSERADDRRIARSAKNAAWIAAVAAIIAAISAIIVMFAKNP